MRKRKNISIREMIGILFLFMICVAGLAQIEHTPLMKEKLSDKISDYKKKKIAECKQNAILEAEIYIDSILHQSMNSPMKDSTEIPIVPVPPSDSIQMPIDTNPVIPLLNRSETQFE